MAFRVARAWPLAVALAAGGCEQGVAVRVDQDAAGIAFTLSAESGSFRPCLGTLELYEEGNSQPVWRISNGKSDNPCITSVRYGENPPGFGRSPPPPALTAGKSYQVEVTGNAFTGGTRFVRQ